jgi:DNA repair protein RecN (Recombination protein N)
MLQKLDIRNYAIIDALTLEPDTRLNTVTGETGAGKSIILGALSLILGDRADTSVLIQKDQKCVVEAVFDASGNEAFSAALRAEELDEEEDGKCTIRREIAASGKSRAFVNDTPVTLGTLNDLTSKLVDLHQQFDHLALQNDRFQFDVLDAVGAAMPLRQAYADAYRSYRKIAAELNQSRDRQAKWQQESDYKKYLLDELTTAAFTENEVEEADQHLRQVSHTEKILGVLQGGRHVLSDSEQPIVQELRKLAQQLSGISELLPEAAPLVERINSSYAELRDICGELEGLEDKVFLNPAEAQRLQERFDLGYKLFKKHSVTSTTELLSLQGKLEEELKATLDLADSIERLEKELAAVRKAMTDAAGKLTAARKKIAPQIATRVNELLALVGMPNARFDIRIEALAEPQALGADAVSFLLDANKSGRFLPIHKAASGGEMARIMLCIKSLTAKAMHLPTLIFDEVDTGISGEAARQVGILLQDLSRYHQVVCITHQPQVAARGAKHFFVYKGEDGRQRITTKVRVLQPDERVMAIARMIGGETPSEAAMQNARELVAG